MASLQTRSAIVLQLRFAIVLAIVVATLPARADEDRDRARAEELVRDGVRERRAGNERAALDAFEQAYALSASPRARAQMGLAAKSLRLYVEAEQYLRDALDARADPWIVDNRATLEQALDVVDRQLAWITTDTRPADVEVSINGRVIGSANSGKTKLRVIAGALLVELRASGHRAHAQRLDVVAREETVVRATLEPEAPEGAEAPRGAPRSVVAADRRSPLRSALYYSSASAAVVGLGVGSFFGIRALTLKSDRDEVCPAGPSCPTAAGAELDRDGRAAGTWATVGFTVFAAAAGVLVYLLLTEPPRAPASASSR